MRRVGKTTLAANLAWASATLSSRGTLLWDLHAQGGACYILGSGLREVEVIALLWRKIEKILCKGNATNTEHWPATPESDLELGDSEQRIRGSRLDGGFD